MGFGQTGLIFFCLEIAVVARMCCSANRRELQATVRGLSLDLPFHQILLLAGCAFGWPVWFSIDQQVIELLFSSLSSPNTCLTR